MDRFDRQINLRNFGKDGLNKLKQASVLIVGAGGLGCPALLYLAAAGVGRLGIVDGDTVSLSNLNRQVLFGENDIGLNKAVVAGNILQKKYSDITIEILPVYLRNINALSLISTYDVILDCTDNFVVRYMVNDACVLLNKPLVYGAIYEYEGQVSVFNIEDECGNKFSYRDLYPVPPDYLEVPNCATTGVIGVLPGIIGTMQATEAIKFLCGIGRTLAGKVLYCNIETWNFIEIALTVNCKTKLNTPSNGREFRSMDYNAICSLVSEIEWDEAYSMFAVDPLHSIYIDVREHDEEPFVSQIQCIQIPLSSFDEHEFDLEDKQNVFIFCQHGVRSVSAAILLQQFYPKKKIFSLKGGIMAEGSPIKLRLSYE